MRARITIAIVLATACAAPQTAAVPTATPSPSDTPYVKPSMAAPTPDASPLALTVRALNDVPGHATASPDGKWIAAPEPAPVTKTSYVPAVLLFDASGKRVAKADAPGGAYSWSWLPDSSGLYIGLDAPQRAASMGIAELDGRMTKTGLQYAHPLLSRDGKWIVAEHQEGCCVAIQQKEIWIAPRTGGTPRVLARTRTTAQSQPIALLGVDSKDRVVYRDGESIMRIAIADGSVTTLASGADFTKTLIGETSPSGFATLIRGYEPLRWYVAWFTTDGVVTWNDAWGTIVERGEGQRLLFGSVPIWIDPNSVLVRRSDGLHGKQLGEGNEWPFVGRLESADVALAVDGQRLLIARGNRAVVLDLNSGRTGDAGIDLGTDAVATRASALPSGGFIVSIATATYRID